MPENSSTMVRRIMRIITMLSIPGARSTREIHEQICSEADFGSPDIRQIQRDLQTLEQCDVIEHEEEGRTYFWSLRDTHRNILPLSYKGSELLSLYVLKSYLHQFQGTSVEVHTKSLLKKLEQSAGGEVISAALEHSFGRYVYTTDSQMIERVISFIRDAKWVTVTYTNNAGVQRRFDLMLCRLFSFNGELYVASYHPKHRDYIALALRKIEELNDAEQDYGAHSFDEERFLTHRFGVFHGEPHKMKLLVKAEMAEFFLHRSWHPTQTMTLKKNGDLHIELKAPLSPDLVTWIIGWSSVMKVLSPASLAEAVQQKLRAALEWYQ